MLSWDIETEPLPEETLLAIMPAFDESEVKFGNTKDEEKRAKIVVEAREKHRRKFVEDAAFNASTATVLAIGYHSADTKKTAIQAIGEKTDEFRLINDFWSQASKCKSKNIPMVGINIHGFDLPFLCRRSWILGIDVPGWVREQHRYWSKTFVDLCEVWRCGQQWQEAPASFNALARYFGDPGKPEGCDGSIFYQVWRENRELAIQYLVSDVEKPAVWARRMGVVS